MTSSLTDREFTTVDVAIENQVAQIRLKYRPRTRLIAEGKHPEPYWELFEIFNDLRMDNGVRIVVMSGEQDGEFLAPEEHVGNDGNTLVHFHEDSSQTWKAMTAIMRIHEAMATLDRPIIAKVNGDALSFGSSLMFGCDLIVAREDARIADNHLGMGEVRPAIGPHGVTPGDGNAALLPLHLAPALAKEYLMLAREFTASDLARFGVINYAVPADQLDALVDKLVERLLRRPAYALAWTKRLANKQIVGHLNQTLDASIGYLMVGRYQLAFEGADRTTLDQPAPWIR